MNPNDLIEPISREHFYLQMEALKSGAENLIKDGPPFAGPYPDRRNALNDWLDRAILHARETKTVESSVAKARDVVEGWQNRLLTSSRRIFRRIPGEPELNQMATHADEALTIFSNGLEKAAPDLEAYRATAAAAGERFTRESVVVTKVSRLLEWMKPLAEIAGRRAAVSLALALAAGVSYEVVKRSEKTSEQTGYPGAVPSQPNSAWNASEPRLAAGRGGQTPTAGISV